MPKVLHCDDDVVFVEKPSDMLSVPGTAPGDPRPEEKRRRFATYWRTAALEILKVDLMDLPREKGKFQRYVGRKGLENRYDEIRDLARTLEEKDYGTADAKTVFGATRILLSDPELRVVHRLDFETSGILCFARSAEAAKKLCEAFRREAPMVKEYIALVDGQLRGEGQWDWPIAKAASSPPRYECDESGKPALTQWRVLSGEDDGTRLALIPVTGRSHQLRVHCAKAGYPIQGDPLYGGSRGERLCLHAARLELRHPSDDRLLSITSSPPF